MSQGKAGHSQGVLQRAERRAWQRDGMVGAMAGAAVRLHRGEQGVDAPPGDIYWMTKTVYLWDGEGKVVSEYGY